MQIRDAVPEDLNAVRRLLVACKLPDDDLTPTHLEHFLICLEEGNVAGIVGLEPYGEAALLRSLAVAPRRRSGGIGTRLLEEIERRARQEGVGRLYLLTTTAASYFGRHGYERVRREDLPKTIQETEEANRLCPSSATCMTKPLAVPIGK